MGRRQTRDQGSPPMPSQDAGDEMPIAKPKKKKAKKEIIEVDDPDEKSADDGLEMEGLSSRRESESREPLTPEPPPSPPQKKKKKKKAQNLELELDQMELANGDMADQQVDGEEVTKKTKRRKKPKAVEMQFHNELTVEDEELSEPHGSIPQRSLFSAPMGPGFPMGKVFVERNRQFGDRLDLPLPSMQLDEFMEVRTMWSTRDVAMRVHSGFRIIGLFSHGFLAGYAVCVCVCVCVMLFVYNAALRCRIIGLFSHGFLAGYAVWNIIVVYVLAGEQLTTLPNLLQQYHPLAYPAQSLLYLLLAISTVSAFDRVNLAKASMALRGLLTMDPAALASLLYFAALILTLSQQMTSDRIHLYPTGNQTLWPPGSEQQLLKPWIVVNLVVALLVGLAWVFISTRPDMDYTEEFLMAMEVEDYRHDDKLDIPT
ncbi:transmembrane protein 237A-like isoform X1 [Alosa alosa]|uniref:transmembrane protein 237A-like isoform X1 n=1 Tax=Alosa alosa TaxID=278164 RepID=UPI002015461E|nr:transmembrane protein 237A-like isoform X1 [Alosa alosa]